MGEAENIDAIRQTLGKLVTEGIVPYNVGENGGVLLGMSVVQAARVKLDETADEASRYQSDAEALRSVLEAAVEHEEVGGKSRRLLRALLPLKPELLGKRVIERRTIAGRDIRPDKKPVTPGTVRNYYEPKALTKLARVLWVMEQEFRANASGGSADSDSAES